MCGIIIVIENATRRYAVVVFLQQIGRVTREAKRQLNTVFLDVY